MDVLAPGIGEIIGGSQREERLEVLDARMAERNIDKEHYAWHRDLRRYGTVPHAGFGLGFERTMAYVTGLANVRDPFPRTQMRGIEQPAEWARQPRQARRSLLDYYFRIELRR
jgi:asparaginyl-tRNA synthetase